MGTNRPGVASATPFFMIALDPGDTTGWATFQRHGVYWQMNGIGEFGPDEDYTALLPDMDLIVIEQTPMGKGTPRQREVINNVIAKAEELGIETRNTYPGHWKPWAKATEIAEEIRHRTVGMPHARDAYCIGRYILWYTQQEYSP